MIKFYLFENFALYSLNFLAPALSSPVAQSGAPSGPFPDTNSYSPIPPDSNIPAGYQMGMATQDWEPVGQQSICTTNCKLPNPFSSTAGPNPLPAGVFAAAISPSLGGGASDCGPCGSCFSIIQSGTPYCNPNPWDPACGAPGGNIAQSGPKSIKVLITNHCTNCDDVSIGAVFGPCSGGVRADECVQQVPGHFDINQAPGGWDNPRIYWKQLDNSECL